MMNPRPNTPLRRAAAPLALKVLLALSLTLLAFGPFKRAEQTARDQLVTAQNQLAAGQNAEAIQTLRGLRISYQDTEAGYEGTALLGVLLLEQGDSEGAFQAAQGVLQAGDAAPASAQNTAHLVAGLALFDQGRLDAAELQLAPLEGVVTTTGDLYQLSRAMAEIARKKGLSFDRARWLIHLERVAPAQEAPLYRSDLQALILSGLTQAQLQTLLTLTGDRYPADYVRFALAREAFARQDFEGASAQLSAFERAYPEHALSESVALLQLRAERGGALEPRKVGVILPLTGRFAVPGQAVQKGIVLARDNTAPPSWAPGGIEFIFRDTQGLPELAAEAVRELALDQNVVAIIGPLVSAEAEVAANMAQQLEVPIITLTQREGIPDLGPFVFRAFPTAEKQLDQLARYVAEELKITRIGILYPENRYGAHSANLFWEDAEGRGMTVAAAEAYEPGQEDYIPTAKRLSQKFYTEPRWGDYNAARNRLKNDDNPNNDKDPVEVSPIIDFEALFVPDSYRAMNLIAPALAYVEIPVGRFTVQKRDTPLRLIGGNTWNHPDFARIGGEYVVGSVFVADYYAQSQTPGAIAFNKAFRSAFGRTPETFSAHGYDATALLLARLAEGEPRSRLELATRIAEGAPFEGATGTFSFDERGDLERDAFILSISRRGNIVQLYPPQAQAD